MNTIDIKQQLHQFIDKSDDVSIIKLFEMFKNYLEQNKKSDIVSYSTTGESFTKEQYVNHINTISDNVKNGANTSTSKEVKKFITNS